MSIKFAYDKNSCSEKMYEKTHVFIYARKTEHPQLIADFFLINKREMLTQSFYIAFSSMSISNKNLKQTRKKVSAHHRNFDILLQ